MIGRLKDYHAAVLRAVLDVPTRLSGPTPSLSESYIRALRDEYEHSTGRRAGRGVGPFLRFVMQFRAALDPSYQTTDESGDERVDESMRDAIKHALRKPRVFSFSEPASKGSPSLTKWGEFPLRIYPNSHLFWCARVWPYARVTARRRSSCRSWFRSSRGFPSVEQLAAELGRTAHARPLGHVGTGPPRTRVGRRVLYRRSSVQRWLVAQEHQASAL